MLKKKSKLILTQFSVISNVNLGLENVTDRRYTDHYVNIQYTLECCNSIANYIDFEKLSNDVQMIT